MGRDYSTISGKKIFQLDIPALAPRILAVSQWESIANALRGWKNVSRTRSAPKTRDERALNVIIVPATDILGTNGRHASPHHYYNVFLHCEQKKYVF